MFNEFNKIAAIDLGDKFFKGPHPLQNREGVGELVTVAVSNALVIAGTILIITIVYAGSSMITASGDTQQFARARGILTSAIIGFIIVVASWFIVRWIEASTGASILETG